MEDYKLIFLNENNIDTEHICCAIGNDKVNKERAEVKKAWLREEFKKGHCFLKVDVRGKVFIEYCPAESAWFPITATGFHFIQCLWASGKYKGQGLGKKLLTACEEDCRMKKSSGLVAITNNKKAPYTVDKKFFLKQGFKKVDEAPPYFELYVKKFDITAPDPVFKKNTPTKQLKNSKGVLIYYSDMCPFNAPFVKIMAKTAEQRGLKAEIRKIKNAEEAQSLPTAWGNCSVYLDGNFVSHMAMTEKMFNALLDEKLEEKNKEILG
ncbi:MAG: GNAT family N-acetyltransferase [Spirochaetales bacterium]|nr:GNAT family N-acetyltransferase [Spirochaetales bacterium]